MTLIIGAKGSMGRRYQAILKWLKRPYLSADINDDWLALRHLCTGVILATPTNTHVRFLELLHDLKIPILCEKPITTDLSELNEIYQAFKKQPLQMVMQYRHLDGTGGDSFYDYYNHGKDGLYWDTMQIIGLARSRVMVKEESPIWTCSLNGRMLSVDQMDSAYIATIRQWFEKPFGDLSEIKAMHEKVSEFTSG
jgi:hypothetical protein